MRGVKFQISGARAGGSMSFQNTLQLKGVVNYCLQLTVKKIRTLSFVFRFEKEHIMKFLLDLESVAIRDAITPYLLAKVQCLQLNSTREDFLKQTHGILKTERHEQGMVNHLRTSCATFKNVSQQMQKNLVSRIVQYFFLEVMVKMEVGVENAVSKENAKVERQRKKVDLLGLSPQKRNALTTITNCNKITENTSVTRYVAGYTAFSLIKKKKCPPELAKRIMKDKTPIGDFKEPDETEAWTLKLSRGGLITVTDQYFNLIKLIKQISDLIYVTDVSKIRHQNLKTTALRHILQNSEINERWHSIYSQTDAKKWLLKLLDCFLNTRGKVLIRDLLEQYQYETREALKAKKSLRKGLLEKSLESKIQPSKQENKTSKKRKANTNHKQLPSPTKPLKTIPVIHIPDNKRSPQKLITVNDNSEYSFLNGDPDLDLFEQFKPPRSQVASSPKIGISSQTLGNINENPDYDFLNGDPDFDLFQQFIPQYEM